MFFGERIDNVKIVGTGRITGNGNLVTSDKVMNNAPRETLRQNVLFETLYQY